MTDSVQITQEMKDRLAYARSRFTLRQIAFQIQVHHKTLEAVSNGTINFTARENAESIMRLPARQQGRPVMEYAQFRQLCNSPEMKQIIRNCCTNYDEVKKRIREIKESMI